MVFAGLKKKGERAGEMIYNYLQAYNAVYTVVCTITIVEIGSPCS